MDVSKLKFDICIKYNCDEGEDRDAILEYGTYAQAKQFLEDLDRMPYGYYNWMSIDWFDVYDENGEPLNFSTILDGDYE